jgi:hypothetical protein
MLPSHRGSARAYLLHLRLEHLPCSLLGDPLAFVTLSLELYTLQGGALRIHRRSYRSDAKDVNNVQL